jgi:hypothetical protein
MMPTMRAWVREVSVNFTIAEMRAALPRAFARLSVKLGKLVAALRGVAR